MNSLLEVWSYKNIVQKATMGKKSVLIVEGIDDFKKFDSIKQSMAKKFEVKPIGTFHNYYQEKGASYVMDFITKLEEHHKYEKSNYVGHILGIVDRDSICYKRLEEQNRDVLYVLEYYSLESFYVNKEVITKTISELITNSDLIDDNLINRIYTESFDESVNRLYYISLEALKKSCESNYDAIIGYKPDNINNFLTAGLLDEKKEQLDIFAKENTCDRSLESILKMVKGKWLFSSFRDIYFKKIKELEKLCNNKKIKQCSNCKIEEITDPCLYKTRDVKLNEHTLEQKIYEIRELDSLSPIKERLQQLK